MVLVDEDKDHAARAEMLSKMQRTYITMNVTPLNMISDILALLERGCVDLFAGSSGGQKDKDWRMDLQANRKQFDCEL